MKFPELKAKTKSELEKLLMAQKARLRQIRFDLVAGKVKNVREIRVIKKIIAQIQTLCQKSNS